MEKKELIYEGKAKKMYATDDPELIIVYYKDDATAGNGAKKGIINNKGVINNQMSALLYSALEKQGVKTHFRKKINDREQLCEKVEIIPLEVIVRNLIAGSMAKRLNIPEGTRSEQTIYELCYKNDELGDPLINDHHAIALKAVTQEELNTIYALAERINTYLRNFFLQHKITLVDFKLEFGRRSHGEIILADEISPDTCRLWDSESKEKLDKDRFRRDLGGVEEAYEEVLRRIGADA